MESEELDGDDSRVVAKTWKSCSAKGDRAIDNSNSREVRPAYYDYQLSTSRQRLMTEAFAQDDALDDDPTLK